MQIVIVGLAIVVMAGVGYFFLGTSESEKMVENTNNSGTGENENTVPKTIVDTNHTFYKNGVYSQVGNYISPAGAETVTVTLEVMNDVVTNATFKGGATNKASITNQGKFASGFSGVVVGQPVDSIALTVVNGSSLTPKGFMDALSKIKSEAKI